MKTELMSLIMLSLIISSTMTYPVLAAEQGTPTIDSTHEASSSGVLGWLQGLLSKLFGWEEEAAPAVDASPKPYIDYSLPSNELLRSLKDLEIASAEYASNFDSEAHKSEFLQAASDFIASSSEFALELQGSSSSAAIELRGKLSEFAAKVEAAREKAVKNTLTSADLDLLLASIASATGKRYEKVEFDRYEEREIYPRVLGAGGSVWVAGGELELPGSVESPTPLPEDYQLEEPLAQEIQALADNLNNNPAKIYWWVRENVRYEPYYGAMQGAEQTLVSRMGNDIDTASLLTALLRASGHPTRYVYGEATATRDEIFDLLGVSDVQSALRLLWGAGIPAEFKGNAFVIERVWVETYIKPRPYMAEHWVQLDPAWKKAKNYTKIDEYVSVDSTINATELQDGALADATINETAGYVTGINTSFIDAYTSANVQTTVLQNITEEFFIPEEKTPPTEVYLPLSMQFDFNKSYEYSALPDALKYKVTVAVDSSSGTLLHYENTLPSIAGKPFALDFAPATADDADKIENGAPAYEINVKPMLYLDATSTDGGNAVYGSDLNVTLEIRLAESIETTKAIYAGEKTAIVIDAPRVEHLAYNKTFEKVKSLQEAGDNETLAREGLYLIGENFFMSSDFYTDGLSDTFSTRWTRVKPGIVFVTKENKVEHFGGVAIAVTNGGTSIDLKFDQVALSAAKNETVELNFRRGLTVSGYEGTVLEEFYNVTGISTVEVLNRAIAENITVYFITQDTIDRLDLVSIPSGDKEIIRDLLLKSPSYFAIISARSARIGNWSGVGYAIIDGDTGAGKYLLSGGLAGGATNKITELLKPVACVSLTIAENINYILTGLSLICLGAVVPIPALLPVCSRIWAVTLAYWAIPHPVDIAIERAIEETKEKVGCS